LHDNIKAWYDCTCPILEKSGTDTSVIENAKNSGREFVIKLVTILN